MATGIGIQGHWGFEYKHSVEGEKHVITMERLKPKKYRPILIWRKYSTKLMKWSHEDSNP
jgi:hypothetical protein